MRVALAVALLAFAGGCGGGGNEAGAAADLAEEAYAQAQNANGRADDLEARLDDLEAAVQNEASTREYEDADLGDEIRNHTHD